MLTRKCRLTLEYSAINLVIEIARPILKREALVVEVSNDAELEWCDTIQSALSKTVLTQSCSNVRLDPTRVFFLLEHTLTTIDYCSNIPTRKVAGTSFRTRLAQRAFGWERNFRIWGPGCIVD